jgi:peptidoglycan/xylan/chitin deacetylase (PgdA/CDA1 family)
MFFNIDIKGDGLPAGTLCLTYDDGPGMTRGNGPGPRTSELGDFLAEWGIPATFFVIGRHAEHHRDVLSRLAEWGHPVGSHTQSHPGLVALANAGGDVVGELTRTDKLIKECVSQPVTFFRAPYGNWREKEGTDGSPDRPTSIVAGILNRSDALEDHVGPVNWDISGHDYDYWQSCRTAGECVRECLERIERIGRGIVLLHDSSEDESTRSRNLTCCVTRKLVPELVARGFRIVRLDEIPQVQSAMVVSRQCALLTSNHRFLSASDRGTPVTASGTTLGPAEQVGVVELGQGRIALRANNGFYLTPSSRTGTITADAPTIDDRAWLIREDRGEGRFALRTPDGSYLAPSAEDGAILFSEAAHSSNPTLTAFDLFNDHHISQMFALS